MPKTLGVLPAVLLILALGACKPRAFNQNPSSHVAAPHNEDAKPQVFSNQPVNTVYRVIGKQIQKTNENINCQESGVSVAPLTDNFQEKTNEVRLKCLSADNQTFIHDERDENADRVLLYVPSSGQAKTPVTADRDFWSSVKKGDCLIATGFTERSDVVVPIRADILRVIHCPSSEVLQKSASLKFSEISGSVFQDVYQLTEVKKIDRDKDQNIRCKSIEIIGKKANDTKTFRVHCSEGPERSLIAIEDASMLPFKYDVLQYYKNQQTAAHWPVETIETADHSSFNRKYNDVTSLTENLTALKTRDCKIDVRGKVAGSIVMVDTMIVKDCTALE